MFNLKDTDAKNFIDLIENITIISDGETTYEANKPFFDFFGFNSIAQLANSRKIYEYFTPEEGYFSYQGSDWITHILKLYQKDRKVKLYDKKLDRFSVYYITLNSISKKEENEERKDLYIITFTNITKIDMQTKLTESINNAFEDIVNKEIVKRLKSEARYQTIFNGSNDAFLIFRFDEHNKIKNIVEANDEAIRLSGFSREEILNLTFEDLFDQKYALEILSNAGCASMRNCKSSSLIEAQIKTKSLQEVAVEINSVFFTLQDKDALFSSVRDITYRKKIEKEKIEQEKAIIRHSKLASIGEMLSSVTAQWVTPLTAIKILADMIEEEIEVTGCNHEQIQIFSKKLASHIDTMASMLNDFNQFFESERQKKRISLKDIVEIPLLILSSQLKTNNIKINHPNNDIYITTYENELKQVIINIIDNAKDAIIDHKIKNGEINISIISEQDFAIISISDNAGGIDEKIIDKIFEADFTTKKDGSGIGLYMSKMIIEKSLDGKIEVRNTPEGAEFRIILKA